MLTQSRKVEYLAGKKTLDHISIFIALTPKVTPLWPKIWHKAWIFFFMGAKHSISRIGRNQDCCLPKVKNH